MMNAKSGLLGVNPNVTDRDQFMLLLPKGMRKACYLLDLLNGLSLNDGDT